MPSSGGATFPRSMTGTEGAVLDYMLGLDAPGFDALRRQAESARVTSLCNCGCPSFNVVIDPEPVERAAVLSEPVAAVAHTPDGEGSGDHDLLLFVRDGLLLGVELVYYGDDVPSAFPDLSRFSGPLEGSQHPGMDGL